MMNTSGITFKDHAGSMVRTIWTAVPYSRPMQRCPYFRILIALEQDLCHAALSFASDTLKADGNFVCKFYQGKEDKALENTLKKMFKRVCREKPESSRSVSVISRRDKYLICGRGYVWNAKARCAFVGIQGGLLRGPETESQCDTR